MYEGNILQSGAQPASTGADSCTDGLRALSWAELVARLGAARDFRSVMGARGHAGGCSFNLTSARHLAALGEHKPGVNPFALADGKAARGIEFAVTSDKPTGDRGRE